MIKEQLEKVIDGRHLAFGALRVGQHCTGALRIDCGNNLSVTSVVRLHKLKLKI